MTKFQVGFTATILPEREMDFALPGLVISISVRSFFSSRSSFSLAELRILFSDSETFIFSERSLISVKSSAGFLPLSSSV